MSMSYGGNRGSAGYSAGQNSAPEGYQSGKLNNFTPEQMQLFQGLFSQLGEGSFLQRLAGGDQSMFEQMEAPAMRQFQQLQGQNASRFSGMGMGARKGSGFSNYQNQATSDFAQDLSSQRMNLQRQALHDLMNMSSMLMGQRPFENYLMPEKPSFMDQLMDIGGQTLAAGAQGFGKGVGIGMFA